ncbi:TsaA-like domain-containing protein [Polychytrium aggregatum]|uniref:TsaA-like domain-containing protein n=1 Tax=Polychytrium aggregatum TaxID=110093 RepID=UPI0022FEAEC0|nr:TsaA-like domain-containing protein [Polychytrium aggregatum]KAI9204638.1 TsaA-like domain-containing protein [Polychytrium aggregatum]
MAPPSGSGPFDLLAAAAVGAAVSATLTVLLLHNTTGRRSQTTPIRDAHPADPRQPGLADPHVAGNDPPNPDPDPDPDQGPDGLLDIDLVLDIAEPARNGAAREPRKSNKKKRLELKAAKSQSSQLSTDPSHRPNDLDCAGSLENSMGEDEETGSAKPTKPARDPHEHCNQRIAAERIGRINAEKALRAGVVEHISDPSVGYPLLVIGTTQSPYLARRGTPRQGLLVPDSRARIVLSNEIPTETLEGLEGYSHLFVQFLFHENTNLVKTVLAPGAMGKEALPSPGEPPMPSPMPSPSQPSSSVASAVLKSRTCAAKSSTFTSRVHSFAAKVLPPLLSGGSIGVFATRAPHRPNALGLSLVQVVSVDAANRTVTVAGADLVNGTPIVDLKPWGPFDCPSCLHSVVDHTGIQGCGGDLPRCRCFDARIPHWVAAGLAHPYTLPIEWRPEAEAAVMTVVEAGESTFYRRDEGHVLLRAITELLALDIRSVHQGRGGGASTADVRVGSDGPVDDDRQELGRVGGTDMLGGRLKGTTLNDAQQLYEVDYDVLNISFSVHNGGHAVHHNIPWISIDRAIKIVDRPEGSP